jgi:ribosome-binding protein aMBF1 (putative translation factor)
MRQAIKTKYLGPSNVRGARVKASSDAGSVTLPVFPHIAARAWRESQGLSRAKLAQWIGFSASQIQDYEEGARRGKKKAEEAVISDAAWLRYGLACAALSAGLKLPF